VTVVPAPVVTLTANPMSVSSGGFSTLNWSATNATSCTASDGWSGPQSPSGSFVAGPLTSTTSFTLTCTGTGGTGSKTITVTVLP
jgi:hypothetical protein